jgi:hypothetical protein
MASPLASSLPAPALRPPADRFMRRLLRLPDDASASAADAQKVFGRSVLISAARCLLTYVVLPILGPILGITNAVGPVLGLVVGAVSVTAITFSMRRFWAANHRMRWGYTALGGAIMVFLVVQAVIDAADLLG